MLRQSTLLLLVFITSQSLAAESVLKDTAASCLMDDVSEDALLNSKDASSGESGNSACSSEAYCHITATRRSPTTGSTSGLVLIATASFPCGNNPEARTLEGMRKKADAIEKILDSAGAGDVCGGVCPGDSECRPNELRGRGRMDFELIDEGNGYCHYLYHSTTASSDRFHTRICRYM